MFSRSCRATEAHRSAALSHDCVQVKSHVHIHIHLHLQLQLWRRLPAARDMTGNISLALAAVAHTHTHSASMRHDLSRTSASAVASVWPGKVSDSALVHCGAMRSHDARSSIFMPRCSCKWKRGRNENCANQQAGTRNALSLNCSFHCFPPLALAVWAAAYACCVLQQLWGNRELARPLLIAPNCCQAATWNEWP